MVPTWGPIRMTRLIEDDGEKLVRAAAAPMVPCSHHVGKRRDAIGAGDHSAASAKLII